MAETIISPFHALYLTDKLRGYAFGRDKLVPVYAASDIKILPYQIAAAMFALRSPYLKGVILCDEGSLGKTYEAMLIVAQKWYAGKTRILITVPTHLLFQWIEKLENCFTVPYTVVDCEDAFQKLKSEKQENPFEQDGIVITTYHFAMEKIDCISSINWDVTVVDEADFLGNCHEDKNKSVFKQAVQGSYKILMSPNPLDLNVMTIYGLIYFIDETDLPDIDSFTKRYFRKPENYPELRDYLRKYCFRTLRCQVTDYVKIPDRIPITAHYEYSDREKKLYSLLERFISMPNKKSYPNTNEYDLSLMLFGQMSSSIPKLLDRLYDIEKRLGDESEEHKLIQEAITVAQSIKISTKDKELLFGLENGFSELKRLGAKKKAIIFTEYRESQKHLFDLLNKGKYAGKVKVFNGSKSRDYDFWRQFKKETQIVIATDSAAKGLDIEYCSFVVNYDMPYDVMLIDQRINRCQRQGQENEVVVLNFLNSKNFYDVRILELVNKRLSLFMDIFGMSDDILGKLGADLKTEFSEILSGAKHKTKISEEFSDVLLEKEQQNKQVLRTAEDMLFTSFTKEIAEKVTITPQYIIDKTKEINDDLWAVTKYFFHNKTQFKLDDETRTIRTYEYFPRIFTGAKIGRQEYSMQPDYQPKSGRLTVTSSLAQNMIHEIHWVGIPDSGSVMIDGECEKCTIGYYKVTVKNPNSYMQRWTYNCFIGKTIGRILSHDECIAIMEKPIAAHSAHGTQTGDRDGLRRSHAQNDLDDLINVNDFIQKAFEENIAADNEEIEYLKSQNEKNKILLERNLDDLRQGILSAEKEMANAKTRFERLTLDKQIVDMTDELKEKEQSLFMDGIKLDMSLEEKIKDLTDKTKLTAEIERQFIINVEGNCNG